MTPETGGDQLRPPETGRDQWRPPETGGDQRRLQRLVETWRPAGDQLRDWGRPVETLIIHESLHGLVAIPIIINFRESLHEVTTTF